MQLYERVWQPVRCLGASRHYLLPEALAPSNATVCSSISATFFSTIFPATQSAPAVATATLSVATISTSFPTSFNATTSSCGRPYTPTPIAIAANATIAVSTTACTTTVSAS